MLMHSRLSMIFSESAINFKPHYVHYLMHMCISNEDNKWI